MMVTKEIAIYEDNKFKNGFLVHGPAHEDGMIGELIWGQKAKKQMTACPVACYEEDGRTMLKLELCGSKEIETARIPVQEWPHLSVEQSMENKYSTLDQIDALKLQTEVKIGYCDCHMDNTNPVLHAAQANLLMTIQHIATGNLYWFGIPYFEGRYPVQEAYVAEDVGKEKGFLDTDNCSGYSLMNFGWEMRGTCSSHLL